MRLRRERRGGGLEGLLGLALRERDGEKLEVAAMDEDDDGGGL